MPPRPPRGHRPKGGGKAPKGGRPGKVRPTDAPGKRPKPPIKLHRPPKGYKRPPKGRPVVGQTWTKARPQLLLPLDVSPNIEEGLEARVKDPLWFLARQWQTGEFAAENGGSAAQIDVAWSAWPLERLVTGSGSVALDLAVPLEGAVEAEASGGTAAAWDPQRLEYGFSVHVARHTLRAVEYEGHALDWDHFELSSEGASASPPLSGSARLVPTNLRFTGMPHPRWWRFEYGDVDLTRMDSTVPNFLQILLAEYLLLDSNNWFVIPLEMPVGHLRRIDRVTVVDAFGISHDVSPAIENWGSADWKVFTLDAPTTTTLDGSYLLLPHIAAAVANGDVVEQIDIARDEASNVVWAVERWYTDAAGARIDRGDREAMRNPTLTGLAAASQLPVGAERLQVYRLMSPVPAHWIPYVPQRAPSTGGGDASQVFLRRARTDESATRTTPQYRTRIVDESWRINEEEVPRTGLRLQRRWRFARGSDGSPHFWVGRRRDPTTIEDSAGLDFDHLIRPT